jgi:hypothetical protein
MPTLNSSNSKTNPASRCSHRTPSGRRCAQPPCPSHPSFCFTHKPQLVVSLEQSIAQELAAASASLSSPQDLNRVLCKLIQAIILDRISLKKAGALGFLAQTILQTQREIFLREKCAYQRQLEEEERNPPRLCAWADHLDENENTVEPSAANPPLESQTNSPAASPAVLTVDVISTPPEPPETTAPRNTKNPTKVPEPPPPPPVDLNHFYPWDPTLPQGRQDPNRKLSPPPQPAFRSNARPANRARRAWFP